MVIYSPIYSADGESLLPRTNPAGYQEVIENLSMSLDPRTANQLREFHNKTNSGIKNIEISGLTPGVFE